MKENIDLLFSLHLYLGFDYLLNYFSSKQIQDLVIHKSEFLLIHYSLKIQNIPPNLMKVHL